MLASKELCEVWKEKKYHFNSHTSYPQLDYIAPRTKVLITSCGTQMLDFFEVSAVLFRM